MHQQVFRARDAAIGRAKEALEALLTRLAAFRVLDPACGSGNFLHAALHALKDFEIQMATNTGRNTRKGAVTARTQFQYKDGDWQKRDERTGEFMERKSTKGAFKGIAKEPDRRDAANS
jgi:hypothetical protein